MLRIAAEEIRVVLESVLAFPVVPVAAGAGAGVEVLITLAVTGAAVLAGGVAGAAGTSEPAHFPITTSTLASSA